MIKVLEKSIADKIAAGEVIERPVSIVKELIENSVDAGATSVTCEIKNGGKSYIRVTDNGCGIPADEIETAFLRHATSKITTAGDLNAICTLGFRGEALASITAVSRTEMVSKTADSKMGRRILVHGSEVIANNPTGCPDGTTIIITDLFYNTPARLKFMKNDGTEASHITEFMSQIALAYPKIRFSFINNGNVLFNTKGNGNLLDCILSVYKLSEYKTLVEVSGEVYGNKLKGYISKPSLSRTNKKSQVFFVNGRVINSKVIEKGIAAGYKERLFEGRHPVCFLFIETDPEKLDVNIHPNKREVRFDRESDIVQMVEGAIKQALTTEKSVITMENVFKLKEDPKDYVSDETKTSTDSEKQVKPTANERIQKQLDIKQLLSTKRREAELSQIREDEELIYNMEEKPSSNADFAASKPAEAAKSTAEGFVRVALSVKEPLLKPFDFDELKLTGSIFGTYITAVDDKNFYLIDQHAAHERIFYEKLVNQYMEDEKLSQMILTPIILELTDASIQKADLWLDYLINMGYKIEEFGTNSFVIKEIPTYMNLTEAENFANDFIDGIDDITNPRNTIVINKLITKSCKSAVKAHDYLSMAEMESLLTQLKACVNPFSCPHGRPTFIRMSQYEIERMFKRA